jgi:hypothetical protein
MLDRAIDAGLLLPDAGAIVTPDTLARARVPGLDARAMLADNGYGFFQEPRRSGGHRADADQRQRFRAILIEGVTQCPAMLGQTVDAGLLAPDAGALGTRSRVRAGRRRHARRQ